MDFARARPFRVLESRSDYLRELPLSVFSTFLVPLIASHALIFVSVARARIGSQ